MPKLVTQPRQNGWTDPDKIWYKFRYIPGLAVADFALLQLENYTTGTDFTDKIFVKA